MTRVLLVTDNERVQKLFEDLERNGLLRLHAVADLLQSDEAIAGFTPEFTFVQSRISGLSGDIVLRHLRKLLPAEGKTVLLTVDPADAAQARKQGARCVELSDDTGAVTAQVTAALQGAPEPVKKQSSLKKRAAKKAEPKTGSAEAAAEGEVPSEALLAPESQQAGEETCPPLPPGEGRGEGTCPDENASVSHGTGPHPSPVGRGDAVAEPPFEEPPHEAEAASAAEGESFIVGAHAKEGTQEAEGAVTFADVMQRATEQRAAVPEGEVEDRVEPGTGTAKGPENRAHLHYHPKERPIWTIPLILIVVLVPLFYLLSQPKKSPPQPAPPKPAPPALRAPAQSPATVSPAPVRPPVPPAAPAQGPEPARPSAPGGALSPPAGNKAAVPQSPAARRTAATPAARPGPPQTPAPSAHSAGAAGQPGRKGLQDLPPFLRGVTLDPVYAKGHPGWERYVGARAEYKLYKEGGLYKAIQVIALTGQTVPDEIFKKVLQEFGGMEKYQLQSTERKQHFLIDHGIGPGNVTVTVYRRINDHRVKGVVLYYR